MFAYVLERPAPAGWVFVLGIFKSSIVDMIPCDQPVGAGCLARGRQLETRANVVHDALDYSNAEVPDGVAAQSVLATAFLAPQGPNPRVGGSILSLGTAISMSWEGSVWPAEKWRPLWQQSFRHWSISVSLGWARSFRSN